MTDKPRYAFRKMGEGILVADMEMDKAALEGLAYGERVEIVVKQFRNLDRLRSYWALLHDCIQACGLDMPTERLSQLAKFETGTFDEVRLPDGAIVVLPRSISFVKMTESEFVAFYRSVEKWLAETYGYVNERELT